MYLWIYTDTQYKIFDISVASPVEEVFLLIKQINEQTTHIYILDQIKDRKVKKKQDHQSKFNFFPQSSNWKRNYCCIIFATTTGLRGSHNKKSEKDKKIKGK